MNECQRRLISYVELGKSSKFREVWDEGEVQTLTGNLASLVTDFEGKEQERVITEEKAQTDALNLLTLAVFGLTGLSAVFALVSGLQIASAISKQMNQETSAIASEEYVNASPRILEDILTGNFEDGLGNQKNI